MANLPNKTGVPHGISTDGISRAADLRAAAEVTIPVLEERLEVGVRQFETGRGMRVNTTVTQRDEAVDLMLRSDEMTVERVPVDRVVAADEAPVSRQEGSTWIIPVLEEIIVVEKRVRIKEELRITRTEHQHRHAESVPLRSEHVSIERLDGDGGKALTPGCDDMPQ